MTVFSLPIRAPRAAVSERVEPRRCALRTVGTTNARLTFIGLLA